MKDKEPQCSMSKRLWSVQEDELLKKIVGEQAFPKWTYISQEFNETISKSSASFHVPRTNKQCRQRWQNHLNPTLKNHLPWSEDQHRNLFRLFKEFSHQWRQLAAKLQSNGFQRRGQNNIKNYFYSAIKRQIKRMNEIIRENNKQTKKKKSQINQYRKKYGYNRRLSLQRQILGHSALSTKYNFPSFTENSQINLPKFNTETVFHSAKAQSNGQALFQEQFSSFNQQTDLHIIKQLDYELISKILLIAEDKGSKKFVISSNQSKECHQIAQQLRNQFIQLIIQRERPFEKERVRQLAIKMLKISRKCKRKTLKASDNYQENNFVEDAGNVQKRKIKNEVEADLNINATTAKNVFQNTFNQKAELQKYFRVEQRATNKFSAIDFIKNSQQFKNQQAYNSIPLGVLSSYDSGRPLIESRNLMQGSSDFLYNNFSISNCFEKQNGIQKNSHFISNSNEISDNRDQKSQGNHHWSWLINNIPEVQTKEEKTSKQLELNHQPIIFPIIDFSILPSQKKSIISSQPLFNSVPYSQPSAFKKANPIPNNQPNDGHFLTHSWAFSSDNMEQLSRRNSVQNNNREEWGFTLPKQNYQHFGFE